LTGMATGGRSQALRQDNSKHTQMMLNVSFEIANRSD
jgi:hypothetical protein